MLILFVPLPLVPFLIASPKYRIRRERFGFYLIFGLIGALLQVTQFGGIVLGVPVAMVAFLLYTQPIWTTVLGKVMLHEAITRQKIVAAVLALAGMMALTAPAQSEMTANITGLLSAILAGLFLSLWIIWGRKSGLKSEHFVTTTFGYTLSTSLVLLTANPFLRCFTDSTFLRFEIARYASVWPAVAGFAIFASLLPAILAFSAMRRVDASTAGILLLLEPVSAAILAYFCFGQELTAGVWFGGGCILLANYVLLRP